MATHSSVLAWRIPGTGDPGGLLSMGLHRVRDDGSDLVTYPCFIFFPSFLPNNIKMSQYMEKTFLFHKSISSCQINLEPS